MTGRIIAELDELHELGLIDGRVHKKACAYVTGHADEFAPERMGPLSTTDAVDMVLSIIRILS